MRIVAIDTSTDWCSVALWSGEEGAALERRADRHHAELALPMLRRLLATVGAGMSAVDAVAFGAGPGSFTGLRIACGIAQGLAMAGGLPVIGISTLEAMAEESGALRVVVCLDARMQEVYYACLERAAGEWHPSVGARCIAPAAAPVPPGAGWVGCGGGFSAYGDALEHVGARVLPNVHPTAAAVARLAAPRLSRGEGVDAALAAPVYLRDKVALTVEERLAR